MIESYLLLVVHFCSRVWLCSQVILLITFPGLNFLHLYQDDDHHCKSNAIYLNVKKAVDFVSHQELFYKL